MFKSLKIIDSLFLFLFFPFLTVSGQSITLNHTYSFEKGYYNTFMEVRENEVGLICPNLRRIYLIDSEKKKVRFFNFKNGRGPGEIVRGPFGLDITKDRIYLGDPDAQRFSVYNRRNNTFKTVLHNNVPPMSGIYHYEGNSILVPPKTERELAYYIYDPIEKKVVKQYKLPKVPQNGYRYSGEPAVTDDYLVHFNRYYADLLIWDKKSTEFIKTSVIKEVGRPEAREAKLGNLIGTIPPQNPELKIIDIAANPANNHHVFLLMESDDGEYKTNWVYSYDFMQEKIVGKYELKAKAYLMASNNHYLFIYSEVKDKLYQYKINQ